MRGGRLGAALCILAVPFAALADPELVALTDQGALLVFSVDHPEAASTVSVRGLGSELVGIDLRPADQRIYGVTKANEIYAIDAASGEAEEIASLTVPFDGGPRSGIAFNPQADRLRLVSADGQNLRVNVDNGATALDRSLTYPSGDAHGGERPGVCASAYTNSVRGAATTKLFNIDATHDVLAVQDPPNDGVQRTIGPLGVDFGPLAGFAIVTDSSGRDRAYAASGSRLYAVDLATGAATPLGAIGGGDAVIVSLSARGGP
jgi:Domain of unknown function (DUF4394)